MSLHKYELSGRTILHNVICVEWMKICKCENFEVEQNIFTTDKFMSRHCLKFVAILVLFVATKRNQTSSQSQEIFSRHTFCRNKVSSNL